MALVATQHKHISSLQVKLVLVRQQATDYDTGLITRACKLYEGLRTYCVRERASCANHCELRGGACAMCTDSPV